MPSNSFPIVTDKVFAGVWNFSERSHKSQMPLHNFRERIQNFRVATEKFQTPVPKLKLPSENFQI